MPRQRRSKEKGERLRSSLLMLDLKDDKLWDSEKVKEGNVFR